MRLVDYILEDRRNTKTSKTSVGRWVTIDGVKVFIDSAATEKKLDKMKPGKPAVAKKTVFKRKDGSEGVAYSYDQSWTEEASRYKFSRVGSLARDRQVMDSQTADEMSNTSAPQRERDTAASLRLMMKTGMRPNPGGMSHGKKTYGATSVTVDHVTVKGDVVELDFLGKSGVDRHVVVEDRALVEYIKGKKASLKAGEPLFGATSHAAVESRIKKFNKHYKVKDLRTAKAMEVASAETEKIISEEWDISTPAKAKKAGAEVVKRISEAVSRQLGNTPSVARSNYISPAIFQAALEMIGIKEG